LRDRAADVPSLTAAFLGHYSGKFGKAISGVTPSAEALLAAAPWPGNVRQLRNVIERACLLCEGHLLTEGDIARALGTRATLQPAGVPGPVAAPAPAPSREQVLDALDKAGGNKSLAARRLAVSRRALYRLVEKHRLDE